MPEPEVKPGEPGGTPGAPAAVAEPKPWLEQVEQSLRGHEALKDLSGPNDLAKAYIKQRDEFTGLRGEFEGAIKPLGKDATPEQREAYLRALGKPEKPTEYAFPITEGIERDPKFVEWAQNTFHKIGIPKEMGEQVAAQFDAFTLEMIKANQEAVVKAKADAETKLKAELGAEYPAAVELTKRFLTKHAKPEDMAFLDESGMGNHPAMIRMIVAFAKLTGEDTGLPGAGPRGEAQKAGMNYTTMGEFKGG